VSVVGAIKSAWAKFSAEFWQSFYEARAESRAGAQPAPPAAGHPFFESEAVKAALIDVVRAAFADGVAAEKARVEAILTAPAAAMFIDLAADLVRGPATAAQAAGVLARAETDAAKRASLLKTSLLESANASAIH
jgi:hypothetical protein